MKPELLTVGQSQSHIVVIDDFSGRRDEIRAIAKTLAPFPLEQATYYPGLRRRITEADGEAGDYAVRTLEACAPFVGGAFDIEGFDWEEASFSMVTTAPTALSAVQKAPHFDEIDPKYLAVLHYLSDTPNTGTAFYRHKATGFERISEANRDTYLEVAKAEAAGAPSDGYIFGSNPFFEQIGFVAAVPDRLVIYQGSLLHSGIIPRTMVFSDDPMTGRLTGNIFIRGH